jgi:hypothetical protein
MPKHRVSPAAAELSSWGDTFSCYTAALAVWLAGRQDRWWRPLLAGGPILAITPAADGLLRFEHHPRPLLETLRLTVRHADNWTAAHAAQRTELAEQGALIVCGDVYNLPWQRGHRRWHVPHWFTIIQHDRRWLIIDPLAMNTPAGPQRPSQVPVDPAQIALWSSAPPSYPPAHRLRELSMAGYGPPGPGARYRWLESAWAPRTGQRDPGRLGGSAAVNALAARFRTARHDDPIHHQADDLWQALRQRELLIAAAEVDPGLVHPAALDHWRRAVIGWRRIPPALMHARLRGQAGLPIDRDRLADALVTVAAFEGRCQLTDETVAARPGIADGTRDD